MIDERKAVCALGRSTHFVVALVVCVVAASQALARDNDQDRAVQLDARRLLGAAYYGNDKYAEAAEEFRRCVKLAPNSAADHYNLALVLLRATEYEEALRTLDRAEKLENSLLGVHYLRGIIYKRQAKHAKAIDSLKEVVTHDPNCLGAHYNLGVCYKAMQRFDEAVEAFAKAIELTPNHPSSHYQLMILYRRMDKPELATRHKQIFNRVKDTVSPAEKTAEALERSQYTYVLKIPRLSAGLVPQIADTIKFADVTRESGLAVGVKTSTPIPPSARELLCEERIKSCGWQFLGAVALGDYDGDGDLDLYVVNSSLLHLLTSLLDLSADAPTAANSSTNRLWQNDGSGQFRDVTQAAGVGLGGFGTDAIFGDYDNDGHNDLYVVNLSPNVLFHNRGDGTFEDVSVTSRTNEPLDGSRATFFDYDHDHDLDLFIANYPDHRSPESPKHSTPGESNTLLRNNGDGTFVDQTDESGMLLDMNFTRDLVAADFDGDFDTDLFVLNEGQPCELFINDRMGSFSLGGSFSPPLTTTHPAVAMGDFDRDGDWDLIFSHNQPKLELYLNDGKANFTAIFTIALDGVGAVQWIRVLDYNNDGWSDLLLATSSAADEPADELRLLAGAGIGEFKDRTNAAGLDRTFGRIADVTTGDIDGDGDEDIVLLTRGGGPVLLRNESSVKRNWLGVRLVGKKVNRNGYGATVEIASGGHYQKLSVTEGAIRFGLGDLTRVDVVRVIWPNGVAQNVIRPPINQVLTIEEYVKVSASCAFLYAYNGTKFELVNEIMGVGPLGVPMSPGVYHQPDSTELTKISSSQLAVSDGYYELRLTEELRETMYADQLTLRVVDHPANLEVIPNEMFKAPPFPEDKLFAVSEHRPPSSTKDDRGVDVLAQILDKDGRYPTFPLTPYDGLAESHSLTIDLGDLSEAREILLFLDGWIYWPDSSTVIAIAQDPRYALAPLSLEVPDSQGKWQTAIESVGLPTSKGLVVPVDMSERFLCDDYRIRLSTNLCIYFDRIFVSTQNRAEQCRVTELPVARAELGYRGFSRMTRDPLGFEYFDYDRVSEIGSWSPPAGMLTRYGEVTSLLAKPDDMYVIFGPGDELNLRFDATGLPKLPVGWQRDFVFYANGWVKDGDLNTRYSQSVAPLPFHEMSGYPYPPTERYPNTAEHKRYLRTFNTRPAKSTLGVLSAHE